MKAVQVAQMTPINVGAASKTTATGAEAPAEVAVGQETFPHSQTGKREANDTSKHPGGAVQGRNQFTPVSTNRVVTS